MEACAGYEPTIVHAKILLSFVVTFKVTILSIVG